MRSFKKKYWKNYYENGKIVNTTNFQKNVGRTKKGVPITDELWGKTIKYIKSLLSINSSTDIIELCCGNGQVIGKLSSKCKTAIGVDFSDKLLKQMENQFGGKVKPIKSDVLDISFENESFDVVIIYFSIQHFNEKETIVLVEHALSWLRQGGRLFIGDIPNELKKWEYLDKPSYRENYITRVLNDTPMIGNWFQPEFFNSLVAYFKNITVRIIDQPSYQINSDYRYDVLIEKK